jgi:hypothetical protein
MYTKNGAYKRAELIRLFGQSVPDHATNHDDIRGGIVSAARNIGVAIDPTQIPDECCRKIASNPFDPSARNHGLIGAFVKMGIRVVQ